MTAEYKLIAKLGNLKTVIQLLRAINFKEVNIKIKNIYIFFCENIQN